MSVEIIAKLEADLRAKLRQPNLVLADYFDFVCGTSTGAVIATCIAIGMSMDKLRGFYVGKAADGIQPGAQPDRRAGRRPGDHR